MTGLRDDWTPIHVDPEWTVEETDDPLFPVCGSAWPRQNAWNVSVVDEIKGVEGIGVVSVDERLIEKQLEAKLTVGQ